MMQLGIATFSIKFYSNVNQIQIFKKKVCTGAEATNSSTVCLTQYLLCVKCTTEMAAESKYKKHNTAPYMRC